MPEFCKYRNCHNLGDRWYDGYCNEIHMKRGWLLEKKEEVEAAEAAVKKAEEAAALKDKQKATTSSGAGGQGNHTLYDEASKSRG